MFRPHISRARSLLLALTRLLLFSLFRRWATEGHYEQPAQVMGYTGWVELPIVGVVAFRHRDRRRPQYRW